MAAILDEGEDPEDAAEAYLKANPGIVDAWLKGIKTEDGEDALAEIKEELND